MGMVMDTQACGSIAKYQGRPTEFVIYMYTVTDIKTCKMLEGVFSQDLKFS